MCKLLSVACKLYGAGAPTKLHCPCGVTTARTRPGLERQHPPPALQALSPPTSEDRVQVRHCGRASACVLPSRGPIVPLVACGRLCGFCVVAVSRSRFSRGFLTTVPPFSVSLCVPSGLCLSFDRPQPSPRRRRGVFACARDCLFPQSAPYRCILRSMPSATTSHRLLPSSRCSPISGPPPPTVLVAAQPHSACQEVRILTHMLSKNISLATLLVPGVDVLGIILRSSLWMLVCSQAGAGTQLALLLVCRNFAAHTKMMEHLMVLIYLFSALPTPTGQVGIGCWLAT